MATALAPSGAAPDASTPASGPVESPPHAGRGTLARASLIGLVVLLAFVGLYQTRWVFAERSSRVMDVDETSYISEAVDAQSRFAGLHPRDLLSLYFDEGHREAPLLSVLTVPVITVGSVTLPWALVTQVAVLLVLVTATFFVARRLLGDPWSLLAAATVAAVPGIVDYTRSYQFATISAATMTAALWCLLASNGLRRPAWAIGWGVCAGLCLLSRTMMVSLVPGILLAGAIAALATGGERRRRFLLLVVGLVAMAVVAFPWWIGNWNEVSGYLTGYGYGADGGAYGPLYSPTEAMYYLRIPVRIAQELYLPLTEFIVLGLVVTAWKAAAALRRLGPRRFVSRSIESGHLLVVVTLLMGIVALMSSRNKGTGFSLPLVPMVVVLALVGVSRVRHLVPKVIYAGFVTAVLVVDLVMKSGYQNPFDGTVLFTTISDEGALFVVKGQSRIDEYAMTGGYQPGDDVSDDMADAEDWMLEHTQRPYAPIVAVAEGDYLMNRNLVALVALMDERNIDSLGVVSTGQNRVADYVDVLEHGAGGPPTEFLLTYEPGGVNYPGAPDIATLERAAQRLGYEAVQRYDLTAGRQATLWQLPLDDPATS